MTIAFVSLAALMLAAALAFVLIPLLRGGSGTDNPATEARRKLQALEQARAHGILSDAEYAAKRAALGETMLGIIDAQPQRSVSTFYTALAVALLLPACAIVLYRFVGEPRALDPAALTAAAQAPADHGPDMQAAIAKLADKLKQNPDDAQGWALLGRAYKATQRFDEGRDALKHAHDLAPGDADITVAYAEALALASPDHRIAGAPRELLDQALKADPQNQRGLWLSGIAYSQAADYDAAIATWNRLLPLLQKGSDVAASIHKQIAQAQALRDGKPLPADDTSMPAPTAAAAPSTTAADADMAAASGTTTDQGPQITVKVGLDPKLKDKAAADDVLFVFAKAASGPPMPLAIQRLTVAQLPASVTLTDGMGMLPNMKLSTFPQIIIGARISKSGQAIAQSGDLQALSAPVANTRREPVELTIDQVVP
ncbi:MAG: c-type cytochrome biogenesis protein CcmI [Rudaea sp.]